jgi:hypothetical protein
MIEVCLEVSEYLVDSAAFKAVDRSDPAMAGSIPVHLREVLPTPTGCLGVPLLQSTKTA